MSEAAVESGSNAAPVPENRPLRILLVVESSGGGTGRHVADLAAGLCRRGHDVSLVYGPGRAEPEFLRRINGIKGLAVHAHDMGRHTGIGEATEALSLRRWLRAAGAFDVAHAHSSRAGGLLRLALLGLDTPCVYTPHAFATLNPDLGAVPRLAYGLIERLLALRSNAIICVSEHEHRHALALRLPEAKLRVVPNGIAGVPPADRVAARSALGIADSAVCVGTVARLVPQKAVDRLITAFGLLCRSHPELSLVIAGDGPERAKLMQCVSDLGIRNRVLFAPSEQGAQTMAAFDIFALSSTYEAFPYVLLEAAWRGLPIVMADTGGAGVVVRDGENGYVCPQNDVESLASRLGALARDRALRATMGARSMELVMEFRVDRMVDATLTVYREVLRAARQ